MDGVPSHSDATIGVVIVNYRTPMLAMRSVRSLARERAHLPSLRVIVVDGGSGDGSDKALAEGLADLVGEGWVSLLPLPINGGFGWANNQAMLRLLRSPEPPDYIYLLNPDAEVEEGAVLSLLELMQRHPEAGAVGSQLLEPDGTSTGSAFPFPTLRGEFTRGVRTGLLERLLRVPPPALVDPSEATEVDWVTGASVLFRSEALRQSGLFDDGFFLYHEEVELMWRMRQAGWSIWHEPRSRVRHVGGAATGVHSRPATERILPRRPAYWYSSRRRFFVRTRGAAAALLATLLWLCGYLMWLLRRLLGLSTWPRTQHELWDQLTLGIPRRVDCRSGVMTIDDPDRPQPSWLASSS
jgi:N-acetylglucosaminyl-diphospho-decaprenol L-rhamnosyltransferase